MEEQPIDESELTKKADPWMNPDKASWEVREKHQGVDYSAIVGDNRILFLGENHSNTAIREHIQQHAVNLKNAGITHYAIEAKDTGNEVFERLNKGEAVDLSRVDVGPGRRDYEEAIQAMAAKGITVVAVDIDQSLKPTKEEREAHMTRNLQQILEENPDAKIAYLVGSFHTSKAVFSDGVISTRERLEEAGVSSTVVCFAGGNNDVPRVLTDAARKAGLTNREFMLDMRNYSDSKSSGVPFGAGQTDYVIHLPQRATIEQSPFRNMAADYTYRNPDRSMESILKSLKDMQPPSFKKGTK